MPNKIAVSHPGKIGDMLMALPAAKCLSERHNCQVDFYTSEICRGATSLLEYQSYIDHVVIPPEYIIDNIGCGVQPWFMPIKEENYVATYQLGFRRTPTTYITDFISKEAGLPYGLPLVYNYPHQASYFANDGRKRVVVAPRGRTTFEGFFTGICASETLDIVQVGGPGEGLPGGRDLCGQLDFLDTASLLSQADAFVGLMSSNLVLANGFPNVLKFVPHDGRSWDMRHVLYSNNHYYLVNPLSREVTMRLAHMKTYSKSLDPTDYENFTEHQHINNMLGVLGSTQTRFEHPHRRWEYGMALNALRKNGAKDILDVGGGASVFAPAAAWHDIEMNVLQVDPGDFGSWVNSQRRILQASNAPGQIDYIQEDFLTYKSKQKYDAVTCLSVIEHVPDDRKFFKKLLTFVKKGGLLFLTTDFHMSGEAQLDGHLRTYGPAELEKLVEEAEGFEVYGGKPAWVDHGSHVNTYNFASLCLKKV